MSDIKRISVTTFALLLSLVLMAPGAASANDQALPECDAPLFPQTLSRVDGPVELETELSKTLGTLTSIEAEEQSGLSVSKPETLESGRTRFAIDASSAKSGRWTLVFRGEEGACRAVLEVL